MSMVLPHEHYMKLALEEAREAYKRGEVPIGAVIVTQDARIIGKGYNLTETLNDVTAHAEMQAITAAANNLGGKYLKDCTLYVTVEPCPMCAGALMWSQIGTIVIGTTDNKKGFTQYSPLILHPKTQVVEGMLSDECATLMKQFFAERRK